MGEKSEAINLLKNDKFILQVVNEIKKKIKPLTRSNSIFKSNSVEYLNHLSSESKEKKKEVKARLRKKEKRPTVPNIHQERDQEKSSYEALQKKVHDHIVMRKLHLMENAGSFQQPEKVKSEPISIMDSLKKTQRENKQISAYEQRKNPITPKLKNSRKFKVNSCFRMPQQEKEFAKMERKLKKLIQKDIIQQYRKQKLTKIKLWINHRKMISLK